MHELSIASGLVEKLLQFSSENPDKKIIEVRLAVGEFSHIESEQLRFCYTAVITETPLDGSTLSIEKVEAMVQCPHCSYRGRPKYLDDLISEKPVATLQCPACGKAAQAIEGEECAIKSVKYTEANPLVA
jgi:hydrogenase nickel incorporation protein HypA/HybF